MTRSLYAEFTARPGCEAALAALVRDLTDAVRAEPGCLRFEPFTRAENPRAYVVFERYRDEAAFQEHLASEHSRAFNAALPELIDGPGSTLAWLTGVA